MSDIFKRAEAARKRNNARVKKSRSSRSSSSRSSRSSSSRSRDKLYTIKTESGKIYRTTNKNWTPTGEKVVSIDGKQVASSSNKVVNKPTSSSSKFDIRTATRSDKASYTPISSSKTTTTKTTSSTSKIKKLSSRSNPFDTIMKSNTRASYISDTKHDEEVRAGDYGISNNKYRNKAEPGIDFFATTKKTVTKEKPIDRKSSMFDFKRDRIKDKDMFETKTIYESKYKVNPFSSKEEQFKQIKKEIDKSSSSYHPELMKLKALDDTQLHKYIKGDIRFISGGGYREKGYEDRINPKTGVLEDKTDTIVKKTNIIEFLEKGSGEKNKQENKRVRNLLNRNKEIEKEINKIDTNMFLYNTGMKQNINTTESYNKRNKLLQEYNKNTQIIEKSNTTRVDDKGNILFTPKPERDIVSTPMFETKTGGEVTQYSKNAFTREFQRAYKGKIGIYDKDKYNFIEQQSLKLAQTGGVFKDIMTGGSGGGTQEHLRYILGKEGLGIENEGTVNRLAKTGQGVLSTIGITGAVGAGGELLGLAGSGLAGAGGKIAQYTGNILSKTGGATTQVARFGKDVELGRLGYETTGELSVRATQDNQKNIDYLRTKYKTFNPNEAKNIWVKKVSNKNFISGAIPGVYGATEEVLSDTTSQEEAIEEYLDSQNIKDKQDRELAKQIIYDEITATQTGNTLGLVGGISAGTEKLGQKTIARYLETKAPVVTKVERKTIAKEIESQTRKDLAKLGLVEGVSQEIGQASNVDEKVSAKNLAIAGTTGAISAGVLGGMVAGKSVREGLDVKPTNLDKLTPTLETTANILDITEKPGDMFQSIRNKITGKIKQPGITKTKFGRNVEYKPTSFDVDSVYGKLKKFKIKTYTTTPTTVGSNGNTPSIASKIKSFSISQPTQSVGTSSQGFTSALTPVGVTSETNIITPTSVNTPTNVNTPTQTETPSNTETNTPTEVKTPSEVETPTDIYAPTETKTHIGIFTPQNGGFVVPGLGDMLGCGYGRGRGEGGYKINPIKNIKFENLKKFLK